MKFSRRTFLKSALYTGVSVWSLSAKENDAMSEEGSSASMNTYIMPDESAPHNRTWMAFGASERIWGRKLLPVVQENLAEIALSIGEFEPVSMLVNSRDEALARAMMGDKIELHVCPLDDLWIRDTGPVFVKNAVNKHFAVDFNFNGWGNKQVYSKDSRVAKHVAALSRADTIETHLVLEGGGIEVDGAGTAIITESCVLNRNRNPGLSKSDCERELARLLGIKKVIWLPGIKGMDITDGHTDFYARFAHQGVVVAAYDPDPYSFDHEVTKQHLTILKKATDAQGNPLQVNVLETPSTIRERYVNDDFAAGYVNFYVCNRAVVIPEFGDFASDARAKSTLARLFPNREIVALNIDGIAAGGGGIHCATQQEPS